MWTSVRLRISREVPTLEKSSHTSCRGRGDVAILNTLEHSGFLNKVCPQEKLVNQRNQLTQIPYHLSHQVSLGREDPLEQEMATHSSNFAWEVPWTEEPGVLQSTGLQRVRHNLVTEQRMMILLNANLQKGFLGFVFPCFGACEILVPLPGIELMPQALKAQSPNHWTTREFLTAGFFNPLQHVHIVKAILFPVVMYRHKSWTIKKAECQKIDAFRLWC